MVSCCIGIPWGATAGYLGGRVDQLMMRFVDGLYALPFILLVILLVALFGRNIVLLFAALGAVSWLDLARIVRGATLAVRSEAYLDAARGLGAPTFTIVRRHVVPNVMGPALVYATLTVPGVIIAESFLSFPRARRAGATDELGRANRRRGAGNALVAVAVGFPSHTAHDNLVRAQHPWRPPARCLGCRCRVKATGRDRELTVRLPPR